MSEPDWNDADASRAFLEQDYTGSEEAGSQFFQYCMDKGLEAYRLIEHLTAFEMSRYLEANNITHGIHIPADSVKYYPGYRYPNTMAAWRANTQKSAKPKDPESEAGSSAAKRKHTAGPGSNTGITKSRPSKRQGVPTTRKRTKKAERRSESDNILATTSRLQSLRPRRERKRVRTGRVL